ncbi:MAG: DUF5320 domain-containing protein [Chitinispirillaceae bacterium]|nr:DUF5320 domain-containing protein [Chitinispirillaceae bacterium]
MPRGDRTGPRGMGPMTGRGAGFCAGNAVPGFVNQMPGRGAGFGGQGRGFGRGRGWNAGWGFQGVPTSAQTASYSQVDELSTLKNQARYFGDALESINSRISELEAKKQ